MKSSKTLKIFVLVVASLLSVVSYAGEGEMKTKKKDATAPAKGKSEVPIADKIADKAVAPPIVAETWSDLLPSQFASHIIDLGINTDNNQASIFGHIPTACEKLIKIRNNGPVTGESKLTYNSAITSSLGVKYVGFQLSVSSRYKACLESEKTNKEPSKNTNLLDLPNSQFSLTISASETTEVKVCLFSLDNTAPDRITANKPENLCKSIGKPITFKPAGMLAAENAKRADDENKKKIASLKDAVAGISKDRNCSDCAANAKDPLARLTALEALAEYITEDQKLVELRKIETAIVANMRTKKSGAAFSELEDVDTAIMDALTKVTDPKNVEDLLKLRLDIAKQIQEAPGAKDANDILAKRIAADVASEASTLDTKLATYFKRAAAQIDANAVTLKQTRGVTDVVADPGFASNQMAIASFMGNYSNMWPAAKAIEATECANPSSSKCLSAKLAVQQLEDGMKRAQTAIKTNNETAKIRALAQQSLTRNLAELGLGSPGMGQQGPGVGFAAQPSFGGTNGVPMQSMQGQLNPMSGPQFGNQQAFFQPQFGGQQGFGQMPQYGNQQGFPPQYSQYAGNQFR